MEIQKMPARTMLSHSFPREMAAASAIRAIRAVAKKRIGHGPAFPRLFRPWPLANIR